MCGIAGYIGKRKISKSSIIQTLELMKNRGPDHQDSISIENDQFNIYFLNSRLSIIDLDDRSNTPFTIDDYILIYNGEIYNYVELRNELIKKGVVFTTSSDTEVLLRAYMTYGEKCVEYFEGMWSFAIYNKKNNYLFLSRDRFAEKPLYYFESADGIYFGSEIKFLSSLSSKKFSVNYNQIFRYLVNGYKSLYKTKDNFYNEIKEIPFGTNLVIRPDLSLKFTTYWIPECKVQKMSIEDAIEGVRERLIESIRIRLRADVPLAFCLSGGIDSSTIVSIASKIFNCDVATFSIIDPDERYNEFDNIQATLKDLGCKNTLIELKQEGTINRLRDLIGYHDSPLATISYLVHSYLSESISKNGYKVVFSGTAADELFTGYYDHFILHLYEMRNNLDYQTYLNDWKENVRGFVRNPHLSNPELYFNNPEFRDHIYLNNDEFASYMKIAFSEAFTEEKFSERLLRNRMLNELFAEGTRVILHEDDLNSMFFSIENRSPFLDSNLFNFAYSIPEEYLIMKGYGKYLLRESVKGILNDQVRLDRKKKGFNASINSVIDFDKKEDRDFILDNSKIYDFIDKSKIEKVINTRPLSNSFSKYLFNFINVKIFLELN